MTHFEDNGPKQRPNLLPLDDNPETIIGNLVAWKSACAYGRDLGDFHTFIPEPSEGTEEKIAAMLASLRSWIREHHPELAHREDPGIKGPGLEQNGIPEE